MDEKGPRKHLTFSTANILSKLAVVVDWTAVAPISVLFFNPEQNEPYSENRGYKKKILKIL